MKIGFISLGCPKNQLDTEVMLHEVVAAGYELTSEDIEADLIIINTCAFLQSAREEAIETILECADYKNGCLEKIVVTGCLPQKFIDELYGALEEADVFLGISDYEKIFEAFFSVSGNAHGSQRNPLCRG